MIVFDLSCSAGHRFEGWFGSSGDYARQYERGLLVCPQCGCASIEKAPMAPAVPAKSNRAARKGGAPTNALSPSSPLANGPLPAEVVKAMETLAKAQAKALKDSTWVGDSFAEKSRAMHYGEEDSQTIHGQATAAQAKDLAEEGITIAPLPFPVAPPEDLN
ncbi:DUF1178 family protein [Altererythrobacter confluentis]|uniref:DUF1178 family protein n=1 Tax=Allopontixanthobacter confluentis TaxID=1849021 RepID=A0A6L7GE29_9SPHN|nr:DUF1178 family protein [Allopontixanthobacter confluentis]MXP14187.1 DUF1178 family protein [Allopontixanthobacter confluentis]